MNDPAKEVARLEANYAVRLGTIQRKPCEECGEPKSQMHHEDYGKPLEVIWLCRPCHLKRHKGQKRSRLTPLDRFRIAQRAVNIAESRARRKADAILAKGAAVLAEDGTVLKPSFNTFTPEEMEYFREQGKRGGKLSSQRMTDEQLTERARKAGLARQAKARAGKLE